MTNFAELIERATDARCSSYDPVDPQRRSRIPVRYGALLPNELLLRALTALEKCATRKECKGYECCASCGPIYEAEETIEEIRLALEGAAK